MSAKISDYAKVSDSASLTNLDGKAFSIVGVEDSNYEESVEVSEEFPDGKKVTQGIKITTKMEYDVTDKDGNTKKFNKFHTTRTAIVSKLAKKQKIREDIDKGTVIGPVVCKKSPSKKGGLPYFELVDYKDGD